MLTAQYDCSKNINIDSEIVTLFPSKNIFDLKSFLKKNKKRKM